MCKVKELRGGGKDIILWKQEKNVSWLFFCFVFCWGFLEKNLSTAAEYGTEFRLA